MSDPHEPVWRALASPVRRAIMDLLRPAPLSTSDVVLAFPDLSRFAVMQHLGVLEEAGIVVAHKFGRVRLNSLNVVPLRDVTRRWLSRFDEDVSDGLLDLKHRLEVGGGTREPAGEADPAVGGREPRRPGLPAAAAEPTALSRPRRARPAAHGRASATTIKRNRRHA